MVKYQVTLSQINTQLRKTGDLPVFSATLNRIREISSSPESDAMALAMAIMKDVSLSAKVLKISNTPEFNRGVGEIRVISRAVVLLGFERIKNLSITLKLIESFTVAYPESGIEKLLLRAFLNASMARELAAKAGLRDIEETFLCGLLFSLGEVCVACCLPETYEQMRTARKNGKKSWSNIQLEALGGQFSDIGQDLAQSWGFPSSVVRTMDEMTADESPIQVRHQHHIVSVSHQLIETIYAEQHQHCSIEQLTEVLQKSLPIANEALEQSFEVACKLTADMTDEYGLNMSTLVPKLQETGNLSIDDAIRRAAYFFHSRKELSQDKTNVIRPTTVVSDPTKQLNYLSRLSELTAQKGSPHDILALVVEGIQACTAFDRVVFCLFRTEPRSLVFKIGEGGDLAALERFFTPATHEDSLRLFYQILQKDMTLLVTDVQEPGWLERLPSLFMEQVKPSGMVMAPIRVRKKPIGLLYADCHHRAIKDEDFACFNQFATQARIALAHPG